MSALRARGTRRGPPARARLQLAAPKRGRRARALVRPARLFFDDLHNTGIYTWEGLRELSAARWSRARAYLRALRAAGGSRDPRARRSSTGQQRGAAKPG